MPPAPPAAPPPPSAPPRHSARAASRSRRGTGDRYLDVVDSVLISSVHLDYEDGEADGPGGGQGVGRGVGHQPHQPAVVRGEVDLCRYIIDIVDIVDNYISREVHLAILLLHDGARPHDGLQLGPGVAEIFRRLLGKKPDCVDNI